MIRTIDKSKKAKDINYFIDNNFDYYYWKKIGRLIKRWGREKVPTIPVKYIEIMDGDFGRNH